MASHSDQTLIAHSGETRSGFSIWALYQRTYDFIAGTGTKVKPWHFQWLAAHGLRRDLQVRLPSIRGRLLDVGCGQKPYSVFLNAAVEHVGVDIFDGPKVDLVIDGKQIPLPDNSFDAILSTQVLEHAEWPELVREEMLRCLKPGGLVLVSVPFMYNEHGIPFDFRRFSRYGAIQFLEKDVEITEVVLEGGIGSTVGVLLLNWYDAQTNRYKFVRLLKYLTFPLFLVFSFFINMIGYVLDKLDRTGLFYHDLLLVGVKRAVTDGDQVSA